MKNPLQLRSRSSRRQVAALLAATLSVSAAPAAWAATSTWNTAAGNWNVAGNWSPSGVPTSSNTTVLAFHNTGATYQSTNDIGNFTLNAVHFTGSGAGGITLGRSNGAFQLTFAGVDAEVLFNSTSSGAKTFNTSVRLDTDVTVRGTVGAEGNLTFSGAFSGSGKFIVDYTAGESGGVVLNQSFNGPSTFTGGVELRNGRLVLQRADALSSGALTLAGGVLRTTNGSGNLAYTNALNVAGNTSVFEAVNANSLSFTGGGKVQGAGVTRTVTLGNANATLTLGGAFTDDGAGNGLAFAGSGNATLGNGSADTAANAYTGATGVTGANVTLRLNKADGTAAVAGDLNVSEGRVFWNRGNQIADTASVSVSDGGRISLAASGAPTVGFSETIASLAINTGTIVFANNSLLEVTGGVSLANASLDLTGFTPDASLVDGTTFIFLRSGSSISGSFLNYAEGQEFEINGNNFYASYQLEGGNSFGLVVGAPIPEPSAFAALAGLAALGGAALRRRRR